MMKRKNSTADEAYTSFANRKCSAVKRPKQAPPLTSSLVQPLPFNDHQSADQAKVIRDWLDSAQITEESETDESQQMPAPSVPTSNPTSRSTNSRSRSSSPIRLSPQNYRGQVLRRVGILVDADVPDSTKDRLLPPELNSDIYSEQRIINIAEALYKGARELLERQTANEAEWVTLLNTTVQELQRLTPNSLGCLLNRDWQPKLKPVLYTHKIQFVPPQKRKSSALQPPNIAQVASPSPSQSTTVAFANQPHLPFPSQVLELEPAPSRLQPRTPRPGICVGLCDSSTGWSLDADLWSSAGLNALTISNILADLQNGGGDGDSIQTVISDPCTSSPSGMRFPFLMIEAKPEGSATMADAENQSSVSAQCALDIFRTLARKDMEQKTVDEGTLVDFETVSRSSERASTDFQLRTFSLTTEGPMATLWAHCPEATGSSMVWIDTFRITNRASGVGLVKMLARIFSWGTTELRRWVIESIISYLSMAIEN